MSKSVGKRSRAKVVAPQDPLIIPVPQGGSSMASHPLNTQELLVMESVQAHQHIMNESKANIQSSNNLLRHVAVKKFDQVDAIESSAVTKVLSVVKPTQ